jgi:hypothetical protein
MPPAQGKFLPENQPCTQSFADQLCEVHRHLAPGRIGLAPYISKRLQKQSPDSMSTDYR